MPSSRLTIKWPERSSFEHESLELLEWSLVVLAICCPAESAEMAEMFFCAGSLSAVSAISAGITCFFRLSCCPAESAEIAEMLYNG